MSNTIPTTESAHPHSFNSVTVAAEIRSPALAPDLWGKAGTPSSLVQPIPKYVISWRERCRQIQERLLFIEEKSN